MEHQSNCHERPTSDSDSKKVGLIAGSGRYPLLVARYLKQNGYQVYCLGVRDQMDPKVLEYCHQSLMMGFGQFGKAVRFLSRNKVSVATMAGGINKRLLYQPGFLWKHFPDWYTLRLFASHFLFRKKDNKNDSLLLTSVNAFERKGIRLVPATDFVPELLVDRGFLTTTVPTSPQWQDIVCGWKISREIGRLDIGQTVTVKDRVVVAIEALEGTDACIRRSGSLCPEGGFTAIKIAKPNQDMRFDVPSFGLQTLQNIAESGGKVLAMEAGKTIFIDKQDVIDYANKHGIAIVIIDDDDVRQHEVGSTK